MMTYEEYEGLCTKELITERKSDDPRELTEYLKNKDSQEILRRFYQKGTERYKNGTTHDNKIAFGYCITTAVENLSLIY